MSAAITMEQVRTALERIRFAPVDPNERGAAYYFVGGIDALLTLMPDEPEEATPPRDDKRTVRQKYADDAEEMAARPTPTPEPTSPCCIAPAPQQGACAICGSAIGSLEPCVADVNGTLACRPCWNNVFADAVRAVTACVAANAGPAPTPPPISAPLADEGARAAIMSGKQSAAQAINDALGEPADSLPSADPPLTIPPMPTGPGAAPPGAKEAPAACSANPAPAPPPVLAAEGTSRQHRGSTWNAARDAVLAREIEAGRMAVDILPLVNAEPGRKPVASPQAIYARVNVLGLCRPDDVRAQVRRRAGRIGAARVNEMAQSGDVRTGMRPQVWTPDRNALGKRMWEEQDATAEAIQVAANELPAPAPVSSPHSVQTQAAHQGWQRSERFMAAKAEAAAARMRATQVKRIQSDPEPTTPAPAAPCAPEPPPPAAPPALAAAPVENALPARHAAAPLPAVRVTAASIKEEAFEAFAQGLTVRDIAADFGEPAATVSMWHAEWKLQNKRQESLA